MPRSFDDSRRWMQHGTAQLVEVARLNDGQLGAATGLPGWTRKHVISHLVANADALGNLVHWAATGDPTPMYASPAARLAAVESELARTAGELFDRLCDSAAHLEASVGGLDQKLWATEVVTAQGRTVPATEVPWMRSREVWVHLVDLAVGVTFADLPADYLAALCTDVIGKRSNESSPAITLQAIDTDDSWVLVGAGEQIAVAGPLAEIAAYLTGREHRLSAGTGEPAPSLSAWL